MLSLTCQAILFDLDGTLVDSTSRVRRLWLDWGAKHGIEPRHILEVMPGRRAGETIRLVAPHLSAEAEIQALEVEEIADMDGVRPFFRAGELLSQLSSHQWAIVTSGSARVASTRLKHVGLPRPEVFITAEDVETGKPEPDGYLLAASRLNIEPSRCIVIEDSPAGVQAGKSAGMKVIAVAATLPKEALSMADIVVTSLSEIVLSVSNRAILIQFIQ